MTQDDGAHGAGLESEVTISDVTLDQRISGLLESDPAIMADPYSVWAEVRARGRVYEHGGVLALLTSYDDVKNTIKDGAAFSLRALFEGSRADAIKSQLDEQQLAAHLEISAFEELYMSRSDDGAHERLRAIAHRAFTPRRVEGLRAAAERYTDELLVPLVEAEDCDLLELAYRLPMQVIGDLLGVPEADRDMVHRWSGLLAANRGGANPERLLAARDAVREFSAYVDAIAEEHRATGGASELVAALLDASEGDRLSSRELAAMWVVLLFAGHETTTNLIAIGTYELLRNRDQWQQLCADPRARVGSAIEELLRYVTPVQWLTRVTRQDVDFGGRVLPKGTTTFPVLAAANRDPRVFADPDRLDIFRTNARQHVAFGFGPHFCIGYSLARLEAQVAFTSLATRFPDMQLVEPPRFTGNTMLRTIDGLKVRLGRDRGETRSL